MGNAINSPLDLRLPQFPDNPDPMINGELSKIYNALKQIQIFVTQYTATIPRSEDEWVDLKPKDTIYTQNLNRVYVRAAEALSYGDMIHYQETGGVLEARKASAASAASYSAQGFCTQVGGIALGSYGETQAGVGLCTGVGGMTTGTTYYLSTTPGLITSVKPASPNLIQPVGFSLGAQALYFFGMPPV